MGVSNWSPSHVEMDSSAKSVKDREHLYRLIMSQLRYDGYDSVANVLARGFNSYPPSAPSSRLDHLVKLGIEMEGEASKPESVEQLPHIRGQGIMDLEYENESTLDTSPASRHDVTFVTTHKGPVFYATFSHDGRLVATGSADTSIRILDVERMLSKPPPGQQEMNPVIRTLFDHSEAIFSLSFHPSVSILASGASDNTIKLFDYSKPSVKRSYRVLQEVAGIRSIAFHPSGDFMLAGTEQSTLRLYDVQTFSCYVSSDARDQHSAAINSVHYSPDGKIYVTASKDGCLKVWDGVSNRCVNTFKSAHGGEPVGSARLSKNGKFVLTSGMDGQARLWEISSGNCLNHYRPNKLIKPRFLPTAIFNHTEDYVLMGDEGQNMILCWDTRTTQSYRPLYTGHQGPIRTLAHSPLSPAFISGGDDNKVKFFTAKK